MTEVEYTALTEGLKEAMWLLGILEELGVKHDSVYVHSDNQSAIHHTKHQVYLKDVSKLMQNFTL